MFETYEHHGKRVYVRADLKGKHRGHCLCWACREFKPEDRAANCPIANEVFKTCTDYGLVTPVYECQMFNVDPLKLPNALLFTCERFVNPDNLEREVTLEGMLDHVRDALADIEMGQPDLVARADEHDVHGLMIKAVEQLTGLSYRTRPLPMHKRLSNAAAMLVQAMIVQAQLDAPEFECGPSEDGGRS